MHEEVDDFLMREVPEFDGKKIQNAEVTDCFDRLLQQLPRD